MKFVVSSTDLLYHLQAVSRVINPKNTMPILDNVLFHMENNILTLTASDLETTMTSKMEIENSEGEGILAVPAKILNDTLKEFPEQPLTFEINLESYSIDIYSENGKFSIVGQDHIDFPKKHELLEENITSITFGAEILVTAIGKTLFATANDETRPTMSGILFELKDDYLCFVSSDSHKLVRYARTDIKPNVEKSFVLPKKAATLLKTIIGKDIENISLKFDEKNAIFEFGNNLLACRLVEGRYPNYDAVIPKDNPHKLMVDRVALYNTLRRVSVFSNQASNLVKIHIENNQMTVSAQDIDFSISAYERVSCQYEGVPMEIGFKSIFLIEILNNMTSTDVTGLLADPSRAGIFVPVDKESEDEDELMLLMPMMITSS